MRKLVTLEELKNHLNIELSNYDEDKYLISLIEISQDAVSKSLNRKLRIKEDASVLSEILIFAANIYQNRESTTHSSIAEIPYTFGYLNTLNKNYDDRKGITNTKKGWNCIHENNTETED